MSFEHLDKLIIRDLSTRAIVGLRDEERKYKQDLVINVTLYADLRRACRTDDINDSIDYAALKKKILHAVETADYYLIERLAQRIADECLADPRVKKAVVTVEKPEALRYAKGAAVEITRERKEN